MFYSTLAIAALPAIVLATTYDVDVGANSQLKFSPDTITGAVAGDVVNFHYYSGDHSVAQSDFSSPCVPSGSDAIYSGFIQPTGSEMEASMMFSVTLANSDPLWFYCSQIGHCPAGMSMVINPPSGSTLSQYQSAAMNASPKSPATVQGGKLVPNVAAGSSGGSSSSAAASSASSMVASSSSMAAMMTSASSMATSMSMASPMSSPMSTPMATMASSPSAAYSTGAAAPSNVPAAAVAAAGGLLAWAFL